MGNIVNDYVKDFLLDNINLNLSDELLKIENEALKNNVPIIDKEVQSLIKMFLCILKPEKILEFGTAVGFSALFMYEVLDGNVMIDTMERENKINLIEGDCFNNLNKISTEYDLIFVDSSKSHYEKLFNISIQKLSKNGIIIFDNVLYKGMVASDDLVQKRKKTIVKNMRTFIQNVVNEEKFFTLLLPIGDGVMILRRKN